MYIYNNIQQQYLEHDYDTEMHQQLWMCRTADSSIWPESLNKWIWFLLMVCPLLPSADVQWGLPQCPSSMYLDWKKHLAYNIFHVQDGFIQLHSQLSCSTPVLFYPTICSVVAVSEQTDGWQLHKWMCVMRFQNSLGKVCKESEKLPDVPSGASQQSTRCFKICWFIIFHSLLNLLNQHLLHSWREASVYLTTMLLNNATGT